MSLNTILLEIVIKIVRLDFETIIIWSFGPVTELPRNIDLKREIEPPHMVNIKIDPLFWIVEITYGVQAWTSRGA